ncbi:MAG: 2-oxo-4-hydroxy-4-carboxy-5-ureidoimidazoline decarboxylase [Bacteroidota bacterium]|jgi:2-oxo-4-hydroxy-4-carboxy-5-ureidoimidazoline decarboxylase
MELDRLNSLSNTELQRELSACCGASVWVSEMMRFAPFGSELAVFHASDAAWSSCKEKDWLEAFSHHPKIGDLEALRSRFATTRHLAGAEQASVETASDELLQSLKRRNEEYEKRFGFIFIVCATGKSADEMLRLLEQRIGNDRTTELMNAAAEQHKITTLRLKKLLA